MLDEEHVEPYDVPEIQRLLEAAARRRNGARWALALALGLRQGDALGLQWDCVDLGKGTLRIRRSRQRPKYTHGLRRHLRPSAGLLPATHQHPRRYGRSQVEGRAPHNWPASAADRAASRALR